MANTAIGITLPIQRGSTGYFASSYEAIVQVKTNLINLLLTRKGERVFQPEFGSNLHSLVFSQMDEEYEQNVQKAVQSAVTKWMPFVIITDQNVVRNDDYNSTLVEISFSLRTNAEITETVVVEF